MWNPIAFVVPSSGGSASKAICIGFGLLALFTVLGLGFAPDFAEYDEVSRVELLR